MPAATGRTAAVGRTAAISRVARGVDNAAPDISALSSSGISNTAATVSFLTNELATSELQYATDAAFTSPTTVPVSITLQTGHSVGLTGLSAGTTYYYRARATDSHGNVSGWTATLTLLTTGGGGGTSWVDTGNLTGITIGTLSLETTFNSIAIELPFAEPSGSVMAVTAEFRKTLDPATVRNTLDLWPTRPAAAQFAAYGKVLLADPGTSYDVRVQITDGNGFMVYRVGSATTRADNIPDPATLVPTHYVNPVTGNDSNPGTSSGSAWQHLSRAISGVNAATQDMVVALSAHFHVRSTTAIKPANGHAATFLGANDVVTRDGTTGQMLNVSGQHSVLCSGFAAGPTGCPSSALLANGGPVSVVAPWVAVTPDGDPTHTVYKWAGSGMVGAYQMTYSTSLTDTNPHRLPHWKKSTGDIDTPAKWATWVYGCFEQKTGYFYDPTTGSTQDIYARFPGDVDPNTYYCMIGGDVNGKPQSNSGFYVTGNDVRVTRCEARAMDALVTVDGPSQRCTVDHSIAYMCKGGIIFERRSTANGYPSDGVYEYNRAQDNDLWTTDATGASWWWVKFNPHLNGVQSVTNKVGGAAECTGFYAVLGGRRSVIRYNTSDGVFNGIGFNNDTAPDRYPSYGRDVHDNWVLHAIDDAFEPEGAAINCAFWNNIAWETFTFYSTAPIHYGPLFFFKNQGWRIGARGIKDATIGTVTGNGFTALGHKYSGSSSPACLIYELYNTLWTDYSDVLGNQCSGGERFGGGSTISERLWLKGNIKRTTNYVYKSQQATGTPGTPASQWWVEDYNRMGSSSSSHWLELSGFGSARDYPIPLSLATYRSQTGQGAHSNLTGDFNSVTDIDAGLTDPTNGDLTLAPGSPFINAGVPVANIMDLPGVHYSGTAPDLGATQTTDEGIMGGLAALLT